MRFQLPSPLEIQRIRRFLKKKEKERGKGVGGEETRQKIYKSFII